MNSGKRSKKYWEILHNAETAGKKDDSDYGLGSKGSVFNSR